VPLSVTALLPSSHRSIETFPFLSPYLLLLYKLTNRRYNIVCWRWFNQWYALQYRYRTHTDTHIHVQEHIKAIIFCLFLLSIPPVDAEMGMLVFQTTDFSLPASTISVPVKCKSLSEPFYGPKLLKVIKFTTAELPWQVVLSCRQEHRLNKLYKSFILTYCQRAKSLSNIKTLYWFKKCLVLVWPLQE